MQSTEVYNTENLSFRVAMEDKECVYAILGLTNFKSSKFRGVPISMQILFDRPNERIVYFLMNDRSGDVLQKIGIDYYAVAEVATNIPMPPVLGTVHALNKRFSLKKPYTNEKEIKKAGEYLDQHLVELLPIMEVEFANFNPYAPAIYEEFQDMLQQKELQKRKAKA